MLALYRIVHLVSTSCH